MGIRSEEHTSELQSLRHLVCRLLLEKKTTQLPRRRLDRLPVGRVPLGSRVPECARLASAAAAQSATGSAATGSAATGSFFFNDTATPEIYTLSLHDALPICKSWESCSRWPRRWRPPWRGR